MIVIATIDAQVMAIAATASSGVRWAASGSSGITRLPLSSDARRSTGWDRIGVSSAHNSELARDPVRLTGRTGGHADPDLSAHSI